MQIGMIGLGRMGANMARRLMRGGHQCVVYDRSPDAVQQLVAAGATGADSLAALAAALDGPRAVWVMVPAGAPTESTVAALGAVLAPGDCVIDGGNSYFKDDVRRAAALRDAKIDYVDAGTSGGVYGLERGYWDDDWRRSRGRRAPRSDLQDARARARRGGAHARPHGRRHRRGRLPALRAGRRRPLRQDDRHNGIEYGIDEAIAEGFDIMNGAANPTVAEAHRYTLPVAEVREVWRRGSVLSSWLIDLTAKALVEDPALATFTGRVQDSGEGRWTVQAAIEEAVPADVITVARCSRASGRAWTRRSPRSCCWRCASSSAATSRSPPADERRAPDRPHLRRSRRAGAGRGGRGDCDCPGGDRARGVCHVALSGGSTPRRLFQVLAAMGPTALPWARIELWWARRARGPPEPRRLELRHDPPRRPTSRSRSIPRGCIGCAARTIRRSRWAPTSARWSPRWARRRCSTWSLPRHGA